MGTTKGGGGVIVWVERRGEWEIVCDGCGEVHGWAKSEASADLLARLEMKPLKVTPTITEYYCRACQRKGA